jgi:hypothetical protein
MDLPELWFKIAEQGEKNAIATLHNEMRPRGPPCVHRCAYTLLPCAVKRLYLFSQSSLIMYSPRALKRVISQYRPLFTHTGLIF